MRRKKLKRTETGQKWGKSPIFELKIGGGEVNNHTMENKLKNLCYPFIQNRLCQFSSANAHREKWGSCGAFSPFCGAKMGQISKCQSAVAGQRNSQRDWL